MPTFTSQRPAGIAESFASMMQGNRGLSQADMLGADLKIASGRAHEASASHNQALAEKVRLELEQMREAANMRKDPAMAAEYGARNAGIQLPDAQRIEQNFRGESLPALTPNDDEGNAMPAAPVQVPATVNPRQLGLYNAARAALMGNQLATGKTNAEQLADAGGKIQGQGIAGAVQTAIANGEVQNASAINQGAKPGNAIKLFDNIGNTGATIASATGAVNANPAGNPLLTSTLGSVDALAKERNAQAGNANASAGQHRAATEKIRGEMAGGPAAPIDPTLTGAEFLKTLPPGVAGSVQSVAEGRVALTNFSTKGGHREKMLELVHQYDPTYNATRASTWKEFTTGKAANNITSINTSIAHIGTLDELADALKNKDVKVVNAVVNRIKAETGNPDINNFETARMAVGDELMRTFRQVGASEQESAAWQKRFATASSPEQFKGAVKTAAELLKGRIDAVNDQWKRGTQLQTDFPDILSPKSQSVMAKVRGVDRRKPATETAPAGWSITKVGG